MLPERHRERLVIFVVPERCDVPYYVKYHSA